MSAMELLIERDRFNSKQTLGKFSIDGRFECYSCEDVVREVVGAPVESWKIPAETAIPCGRYRVTITFSNRFKKLLPEVHGVAGFAGVRLHAGNTEADTEGCPLLGDVRFVTYIGASKIAAARVQGKIQAALDAGKEVWLTVQ